MIFVKISQNFNKSPLTFCLISQILVHSLWHVCSHDINLVYSLGENKRKSMVKFILHLKCISKQKLTEIRGL